jgi:hypothetical protein
MGLNLGIHTPSCASSPRRHHRALTESPSKQVQLREDDLSEMLRSSATACDELQEEEVRTYQPATTKEEDKELVCGTWMGGSGCRCD